MMTGANAQVIAYSKYYKVSLLFIVILIAVVVLLLYLFIPTWGITGAAIAIAGALFMNNLMRYLFLYRKYRLQPFNSRFLIVAAFFTGLYFLLEFIPQQPLIPDILIRGTVITLLTGLFVLKVPVSDDIKAIIEKLKKKLG
jgi:O-antigen/teichoic acid export membrane protein